MGYFAARPYGTVGPAAADSAPVPQNAHQPTKNPAPSASGRRDQGTPEARSACDVRGGVEAVQAERRARRRPLQHPRRIGSVANLRLALQDGQQRKRGRGIFSMDEEPGVV